MTGEPSPLPSASPQGDARREAIARLKAKIARIEAAGATAGSGTPAPGPVTFGIAAIDGHLPGGGLATGAVHEIIAGDDGMAATGFALALTSRLAALTKRRALLWCGQGLPLYGPGLAGFGLDPARLLVARCAADKEALWAMEEGLAAPALAAVLGEVTALDGLAGRRLALAARQSGVTVLVLRGVLRGMLHGGTEKEASTVAATRWRVRGLPAAAPGGEDAGDGYGWRLDFLRGGGALPRSWRVLWRPGRAAPRERTAGEGWPEDHGWENDDTGGAPLAPPGALSLAPPLPGGALPEGEHASRHAAG
jgi:protein ImuA